VANLRTYRKAVGDVVIRHTCDGRQIVPDRLERRMVHVDRTGKRYWVMFYNRPWRVTRIKGTARFICEFAGRTTHDKTLR
jgi:hypothetical protein